MNLCFLFILYLCSHSSALVNMTNTHIHDIIKINALSIQLFDVNPQMWVYKAVCQIVFLVCTGLTWLTNNLQNLPDCHMQKIDQFFTKNKKRGRIFVFFLFVQTLGKILCTRNQTAFQLCCA